MFVPACRICANEHMAAAGGDGRETASTAEAVPRAPQHHAACVTQESGFRRGQQRGYQAQIFEARTGLKLRRFGRFNLVSKHIAVAESTQKNQIVVVDRKSVV